LARHDTEPSAAPEAGLALQPAEREVLAAEVAAFAQTVRDPAARERYAQLEQAVRAGRVPPALVRALEPLLELLLQTQRIRRQHGPEAEEALLALFYRTPRGAALQQAAREVTQALQALQGQTLERLALVAGPGRHTLVIDTDRCRLTLRIDGAGARVESVEVGG